MKLKHILISSFLSFIVIFNLGYLFHEIIAFDFFKATIGHLTRSAYIIPLIALSFVIYSLILSYCFPIFKAYYPEKSHLSVGIKMGALFGFLWDGLQGGLIEVATFTMPISLFFVDSTYHVIEGMIAGAIIATYYKKASPH